MTASVLTVLPTAKVNEAVAEPISARVRRLQAEARAMAHEHILELEHALEHVHRLAEEIADGGDAYPVGVREIARRLTEESDVRIQAMAVILQRNRH